MARPALRLLLPLHPFPPLPFLAVSADLLVDELLLLGEAEVVGFVASVAWGGVLALGPGLGVVVSGIAVGVALLIHAHTVDLRPSTQNSAVGNRDAR